MALSEFSLIEQFFSRHQSNNPETKLGIGDDCALLSIASDQELVVTTDTMVEGIHFFPDCDAQDLGHKLLAVNLSDLASMGAKPIAVTLALTLPKVDTRWLSLFANGFFQLAQHYSVDLIGGDTTSGPLSLTLQALGLAPQGLALRRSAAKPRQLIYLTGRLGSAGLGLKAQQGYKESPTREALERLHRPDPRVALGLAILPYAGACIDISDGLLADLGHILQCSQVGARVDWEAIPLSQEVTIYIAQSQDWTMPLIAGDDYELCFTVEADQQQAMEAKLQAQDFDFSLIGEIETAAGLRLFKSGVLTNFDGQGFEHFRK